MFWNCESDYKLSKAQRKLDNSIGANKLAAYDEEQKIHTDKAQTYTNEAEQKKGRYIRRERYCGSCQRSFYVGDALTVEDIKANFKHGILNLIIPKKDKNEIADNKYIAIEG